MSRRFIIRTFSGRRHALHGADDGGRFGALEDVSQREAARHGVGVRVVVQHDQHAVGVAEVALVLLHAGAGQGAANSVTSGPPKSSDMAR